MAEAVRGGERESFGGSGGGGGGGGCVGGDGSDGGGGKGDGGAAHAESVVRELMGTSTMSEAAEFVRAERAREMESVKRRAANKDGGGGEDASVAQDEVVTGWEGVDVGGIDENEMARKQRQLQERLESKHREAIRQAKRLEELRRELKALEEPLKQEVFEVRSKLELEIREEAKFVAQVNQLRKELRVAEAALAGTRERKRELADSLVDVMADYEKRKEKRLAELADLLGDGAGPGISDEPAKSAAPAFGGF